MRKTDVYSVPMMFRSTVTSEKGNFLSPRGDTTNGQQTQMKTVTIPYIKTISEMIERLLRLQGIHVAHIPVATIRTLTSKPKTPIDPSERA